MDSGILLVDKPEGPSSAQVVQRVKNILGAKKVGHLGALDPFASGLLLLGVNEGTKIAELFLSAQKSYTGVVCFGVETDTQDATGKVMEVQKVPLLDERKIESLRQTFTGELLQTPPMYSALKKKGVPLYRLARQGKTVPRAPRQIRIDHLKLWKMEEREVGFELTCSRGTYIRALAADMGRFLGCGAHLRSLRRLSCGHLSVERAVPLAEIQTLEADGRVPLVPLNQALAFLREVSCEEPWLSRLRKGQQDLLAGLGAPKEGETMVRLVHPRGHLVALLERVESPPGGRWRLFRLFGP